MLPAKKTPGRFYLPGVLVSYALFLILVVNLGETVEAGKKIELKA